MDSNLQGPPQTPSTPAAADKTLVVSATFTAEPLEPSLLFWADALGTGASVVFAAYNQVFQNLLDPGSELRRNCDGANLLLLRLSDWGGEGERPDAAAVERAVGEFVDALGTAAAATPVPWLVCLCPGPPGATAEERALYTRLESVVVEQLAAVAGVHVIGSQAVLQTYPVEEVADEHADRIGHVPYTPQMFAALGTMLSRRLSRLTRPAYKVIALDCDETLWGGVVGEDGADGVEVDGPYALLHKRMLQQRDSGVVLCLVSKNEAADVEAVFDSRAMPLSRQHITLAKVNWERKSDNLIAIARELNLGLDAILFLDDNPVEIAEVQARCPDVVALQVPAVRGADGEAVMARWLDHLWALDTLETTDADRSRAQMYTQNLARDQARAEATDLRAFLDSLELDIDVRDLDAESVARAAQLTTRTNQFNLTTVRRDEPAVEGLRTSPDHVCKTVRVKDRFGDYGLVGLAIGEARAEADELWVDTLLMSCRALGRGAEHALLRALSAQALGRGLSKVHLELRPTQKNLPAAKFLRSVAGEQLEARDGGLHAWLPAAQLAELSYDPDESSSAQDTDDAPARDTKSAGERPAAVGRRQAALYARIANELHSASSVAQLLRPVATPVADAGPYEPPDGDLEAGVAETWCEVLGLERVGRAADFFDIGGNSLIATRVISRLRQEYEVELTLKQFFAEPTVRGIAQAIETLIIEQLEALDE